MAVQSFYADYLSNLQEYHDGIREALKDLPQAALDWAPGPGINSINVLAVHLVGAERYWIGDVAAGVPSGRDREAEFLAHGLSAEELLQKLSVVEDFTRKSLETFALEGLDEKRISPSNGREVTVGWALCHALKHTSLHLGHIEITRQLWEQRQSS
jgi:uncharacterized damage-inducible protein DinB